MNIADFKFLTDENTDVEEIEFVRSSGLEVPDIKTGKIRLCTMGQF